MEIDWQTHAPVAFIVALAAISIAISPRLKSVQGFFNGADAEGKAPGLWTLTLSQVTTWIFARSLMNAAILGFYYGIAGTLAYTAYYLSFITGWLIVDRLRFAHNSPSIHHFLRQQFGTLGSGCYNVVIALRLLTEVFANLLVVGLILSAALPDFDYASELAMAGLALVALIYSMGGGLRASLRTDVFQMILFAITLAVVLLVLFTDADYSWGEVLTAEGQLGSSPGWILLAVAFLQVLSYPMHDPVMTDRGYLADRKVTRQSFMLAFVISSLCIFGFGLIGIQAGIIGAEGQKMEEVWPSMFSPPVFFLLSASLIISALSTLDSALSSSSKLVLVDLKFAEANLKNGRIVMALFMVGGLLLSLGGFKDLYSAVAVSGTASMFLAPVILFNIFGKAKAISLGAYILSFLAAMTGATLYFFIETKRSWALELIGGIHKYHALLYICLAVLAIGVLSFGLSAALQDKSPKAAR